MKIEGCDIDVYRLTEIKRYNTTPKIHNESVAEHTCFVVLYTMDIANKLNLDTETRCLALETAAIHDIPEIIVNDITYDCKKLIKGLDEILENTERNVIQNINKKVAKILFNPQTKQEILIKHLVKLADILSVEDFVKHELKLGNQYLKQEDWEYDTNQRIQKQQMLVEKAYKEYKEEDENAKK